MILHRPSYLNREFYTPIWATLATVSALESIYSNTTRSCPKDIADGPAGGKLKAI